jgi:hypothetical protein
VSRSALDAIKEQTNFIIWFCSHQQRNYPYRKHGTYSHLGIYRENYLWADELAIVFVTLEYIDALAIQTVPGYDSTVDIERVTIVRGNNLHRDNICQVTQSEPLFEDFISMVHCTNRCWQKRRNDENSIGIYWMYPLQSR